MYDPTMKEILDRCRRIETRLTRWLENQGFETKAMRPIWRHGFVHIHNLDTPLREIMGVIPQSWPEREPVLVYLQDQFVLELYGSPDQPTMPTTMPTRANDPKGSQ